MVIWKGPAFLLRITSASSPRVVTSVAPAVSSNGFEFHREQLAGVVDVHQVIDAELVHGPGRGVRRRSGKRKVARGGLAPGKRAMQQGRACQRQNMVGDLLRASDRLDERADLVRHAVALGL